MANSENLKPWPKGTSGNPAGRPRNTKLTPALRELLDKPDPHDKAGRIYAEVIAEALVFKACQGNVGAAKEIANRTEGRPRRRVPPESDEDA